MKLYRFDLTFSYWIVAWYALYMFRIVKRSPKLALLLGLLLNLYDVFFFFIRQIRLKLILIFLFLITVMKLIPLWTLRHVPVDFKKEFIACCIAFSIYVVWLNANGHTLDEESKSLIRLYTQDKSSATWTPATELFLDMQKWFRI